MSITKVVVATNIKREAVLIDPSITAAEPAFDAGNIATADQNPFKNVLAEGASGRAILKRLYGR